MNQLHPKYNPSFSSDEDLKRLFVVRQPHLELIVDTLRENANSPSNQHILVTGPRGVGKTTLVQRVVAELRGDSSLSQRFFPIVFSEESYEVTSAGEFWLEALARLADQVDSKQLRSSFEEIRSEVDDARLRDKALAQLLAFAHSQQKRLVLVVENLNMLLGEQLTRESAWELRHTLLNEPSIILLGTATTNIFSDVKHSGKAWFELFSVHKLLPLSLEECIDLWKAVTGAERSRSEIRAIQILTGGNPRLIRILAEFVAQGSFRDLLQSLMQLVDEHTEYFKSQLDGLAAIERKVFVGVLDVWEPSTAKTIADCSRLRVTTCSAYLNRLVERGAVSVIDSSPRRKLYQASERLFNIYYLMRKRGHPSARIRAAVRFMINFYRGHQLVTSTLKLAEEACQLEPRVRTDHYLAYEEIISHTHDHGLLEEIVRGTPKQFLSADDLPQSVRQIVAAVKARVAGGETKEVDDVAVLISMGRVYDEDAKDLKLAERAFRRAVEIAPHNGHAWAHLGDFLDRHKLDYSEARLSLGNAVKLAPNDSWAWYRYADLLEHFGETDEAIKATRKSLELQPKYHYSWLQLVGLLHDSNRFEAAYQAAHEALGFVSGKGAGAVWGRLAELLHYHLERTEEAETAYRNAARLLKNKSGYFTLELGRLLVDQQHRAGEARAFLLEAEQFFRRRTEEQPQVADHWHRLAQALDRNPGKRKEAEAAHRRAINLQPNDRLHWDALMDCLVFSGKIREAEETAKESLIRVPGADSWRRLGWLYERRHKYKSALAAYQKAAELDPTLASAWEGISRVVKRTALSSDLNYLEAVYLKIVNSLGFAATIWPDLLRVQSQLGRDKSTIVTSADRFLDEHNHCVPMLDAVAWGIFVSERSDLMEYAEKISREAVKKDPDSWSSVHTLASILTLQGNTAEAINLASQLFEIVASVDSAIGAVTELSVLLARAGEAKAVLTVLMGSKGRPALEPLEVALDEIVGNPRSAPQEIAEIATDIVRQISKDETVSNVTKAAFAQKPGSAGRKTRGTA